MAKILIVDDEPRIRDLIREHLQYAGFTCEEAGDGTAALSVLSQGGIDLVILDIMMPFMDGMTCLREMRTRKIMTPVIMLTARSEEYDKLAGLESGADDYVVKPFSPRELRRMPAAIPSGICRSTPPATASRLPGRRRRSPPRSLTCWSFLSATRALPSAARRSCKRSGITTTTARTAPWIPISRCCAAIWATAAATSSPYGASGTNLTRTPYEKTR